MTHRRWMILLLLLTALMALSVAAINYVADIFGVFRDPRGRSLTVYSNERTAKYLLNQRYVPENFHALVIGSSSTANWNVDLFQGPRVYNESMDGGNAAEEKLLVEEALRSGHFEYALVSVTPFATSSDSLQEGGMGTPRRREALGSVNVLREEATALLVHLHVMKRKFYADGSKELTEAIPAHARFPQQAYHIDPDALRDYRSMIAELRQNHVIVIFVVPPLSQPLLEENQEQMKRYFERTELISPGDLVIDCNGPEFLGFRSDISNFDDGIHLTHDAARVLSVQLNTDLQRLLKQAEQRGGSGG